MIEDKNMAICPICGYMIYVSNILTQRCLRCQRKFKPITDKEKEGVIYTTREVRI